MGLNVIGTYSRDSDTDLNCTPLHQGHHRDRMVLFEHRDHTNSKTSDFTLLRRA
jgi:hypothetical protein